MTQSFIFPKYFDFPPFFTLQPVLETKEKQIEMWTDLITNYYKHTKKSVIFVDKEINSLPFENKKIERKLSLESLCFILDKICEKGFGIWKENKKIFCISFRTIKEWNSILYNWAIENLDLSTIYTIFELVSNREYKNSPFFEMDSFLMKEILKTLQSERKVKIIEGENIDETGVKFLEL